MYNNQQKTITIILILLFLILFVSLFDLQIVNGKRYKEIADRNFVRVLPIKPVRGEILDRKYRPIAENKPTYNLYLTPGKIRNKTKLIEFLFQKFNLIQNELKQTIYNNRFRLYQEILLVQNIDFQQVIEISEDMNFFPSLQFKAENIRNYRYYNHFSGYVGKISESEFTKMKNKGYSQNSIIGKTGIEKKYQEILRGLKGYKVLQVDSGGKNLEFFKHNLSKPPVNGEDLILTIDNDLQNGISSIFPKKEKGCIVVTDILSGEILAYVSKPDFDPNIFMENISIDEWQNIISNPNKPMLDRVIHGTYPPGSIYKPIIATLALTNDVIDEKTKLTECTGGLQVGNRYFKCWYNLGHGRTNVVSALKYSCDVFFYDLSNKFTLTQIDEFTKQNFLTVKTEVDLPGERKGFFPTEDWFRQNYGKYISIKGQKVNLAIGQGEILITPLQMCSYYAALGNDGKWIQPHFLKTTSKSKTFTPKIKYLPVSQADIKIIQKALYKVVNEKYGTGTAAALKNITIYGKTGSSENHMGDKTHAWFAGYASWEYPEIAFVVFLENGGHGGRVAAPLAAKACLLYDGLRKK